MFDNVTQIEYKIDIFQCPRFVNSLRKDGVICYPSIINYVTETVSRPKYLQEISRIAAYGLRFRWSKCKSIAITLHSKMAFEHETSKLTVSQVRLDLTTTDVMGDRLL